MPVVNLSSMRRLPVLSTIAQVLSIWFLVATAAALSLGAMFRAVATIPAPVLAARRDHQPEMQFTQDVCA